MQAFLKKRFSFFLAIVFIQVQLAAQVSILNYSAVTTGAQRFELYVPQLKNRRVGIVTNITGVIGSTSVVDTLLQMGVNIKKIFGPEHGFRSDADAAEKVSSGTDAKTGLPVISLYGSNKKPTAEQLSDIDVLLYDIQDVGVRFYTYISTMCYAMEACAESQKEFVVLDRPNPNGFYIDGPVLLPELKSFLGLHPVPIVYGMTCGEYAQMANGEGWLKNAVKCHLKVIPLKDYDRKASYHLPVKPSPNIPNEQAVLLYPGLGLFEGSLMSLGRGTAFPFQVVGHPAYPDTSFSFTPRPTALSKEPKYVNQRCFGLDLRQSAYLQKHPKQLDLALVIAVYKTMKRTDLFDKNFNFHSGNTVLQEQIKKNIPEKDIRKSWNKELEQFKKTRKKYLLYRDFN